MGSQNKAHSLFHLKFCIQLQWIMDFKAISRLRISGDVSILIIEGRHVAEALEAVMKTEKTKRLT